ncbi:MAG TPA: ScyD/ScyE family protein [Amycolatopsis sp.]|nr:ScyD/ScyE family protein [Amycolatopsis sp.]
MSRRVHRTLRAAVLAASAAAVVVAAPVADAAQSGLHTVATGLNSPRHLTFHDGKLYVAEAGVGGNGKCVQGPEGQACFGTSGSVAAIDRHGGVRRIVTGMPSTAGPGGVSGAGPAAVTFFHGIPAVLSMDTAPDPATGASPFGPAGKALGRLSLAFGSFSVPGPDFAAFEAKNNPDQGGAAAPNQSPTDSNPFGMTRYRDGFAVTDAGANDLLFTDWAGHIKVLAVFPPILVTAPPELGLPPGTKIPTQAVPTSVVVGPDGALYVSTLRGITSGAASVYRVVPGHKPTLYADGFSALTDLAFDRRGRLLALSFAKDGILSQTSGVLTRVERDGSHTVLASDGLSAATGLAVAGNDIYISNNGASPGNAPAPGSVVKLTERG